MRTPPPLSRATAFPVTGAVGLLSIALTLLYWSGQDVSRLLMTDQALFIEPWRPFTSTLVHGDVLHIGFNLYWLWVFGTLLEEQLGHWRLLGVIALLALISAAAELALGVGGIGLSGVGYGLLGLLYSAGRRDARFADGADQSTVRFFIGWFFLCIALTWAGVWQVANVAHGSGAVAGIALGVGLTGRATNTKGLHRGVGWVALAMLCAGCLLGATRWRPYVNFSAEAGLDAGSRGYAALMEHRDAEAVNELEWAVRLSSNEASLWYNLGLAYTRTGQPQKARPAFQRAAKLEPSNRTYSSSAN